MGGAQDSPRKVGEGREPKGAIPYKVKSSGWLASRERAQPFAHAAGELGTQAHKNSHPWFGEANSRHLRHQVHVLGCANFSNVA